jgi:beta-lactamase class A
MKKFIKKFNVSILVLMVLFSLTGCSTLEHKSSKEDTNKKIDKEYNAEFAKLEDDYGVKLGVYAFDMETNKEIAYNSDERFAYCSTYKALAAGAVLDKYSIEDLKQVVNFTKEDVLSYAPVAKDKVDTGMTIEEICEAAVRQSDNTAGNLLFELIDGPNGFKTALNKLGDTVTDSSRKETELNEATPGDIRDTSTPKQLVMDLKEYSTKKVLTQDKQKIFIDWMSNNQTGDELIRAGAPKNWAVADKSGAGSYGTRNDIAIVTPPNRKPIVVAVLSKKDEKDADYDNKLIKDASRIIFDYIQNGLAS